ncbi:hypothetical protein Ptr902_09371 [Pyrenophora tritici-repentis]|nr:hypothetical protein Ptr902_09371 [Pyrenophora tritici-repentis]
MATAKTTQPASTLAPAQLDGGNDYHPHARPAVVRSNYARPAASFYPQQYHGQTPFQSRHVPSVLPPPRQQTRTITTNAVRDLLPYCTTEPPLDEAQVIALNDVVGSLRELAVLALCAASGDVSSMKKLEGAVDQQTAANITDFFAEEWEIDG